MHHCGKSPNFLWPNMPLISISVLGTFKTDLCSGLKSPRLSGVGQKDFPDVLARWCLAFPGNGKSLQDLSVVKKKGSP